MQYKAHPWYWRALLCMLAGMAAGLMVSGPILWFSYEAYNPWYHSGGERELWTGHILSNALLNIVQHSSYAGILLLLGPFWIYGRRFGPRKRAILSTLYALLIGFLIAHLLFGRLDLSVTHLRYDEAEIAFVVSLQRIYVPNYLYIIAAYALPVMSAWCLAGMDAALSKWRLHATNALAKGAA